MSRYLQTTQNSGGKWLKIIVFETSSKNFVRQVPFSPMK